MESERSHTKDRENRVLRRSILAAAAGSGLTAFGSVVTASDDTIDIPIIKSGNEVVKWKSVPEDWWDHESRSIQAMEELIENYESNPAVVGVGVRTSPNRIDGKRKSVVRVDFDPNTDTTVSVPQTVNGVAVTTRERPEIELHNHHTSGECDSDQCDEAVYDLIRGGVELDGAASATCKVTYNGFPHIMCAAHAVDHCHNFATSDDPMFHNGQYIGDLVDHDADQDWAIMELADDGEFSNPSERIAGYDNAIFGHVGQQGLHDMMADGETSYHRGITTCTTAGHVDGYGEDLRYDSDCEGSGIYIDFYICTYGGDSGGPHYRTWTDSGGCDWAAIIAPHKGGVSGEGYQVGCAAYEIVDNHPIEFPSQSICGPIN